MLHTKFQAPAVNGSEEEKILNMFLCTSMAQSRTHWGEANMDSGPPFEQT